MRLSTDSPRTPHSSHASSTLVSMRHPAPFPSSLRSRAFTLRDAEKAGVSKERLRRRDVQRIGRGVYRWIGLEGDGPTPPGSAQTENPPSGQSTTGVDGGSRLSDEQPYTWTRHLDMEEMRRLDHLLHLRESVVLSHVTAARVQGLWLPARVMDDPRLHLTRDPRAGVPRARGFATHRSRIGAEELVVSQLLGREWQVTDPIRTWLDMAALLERNELIAFGDHLARRAVRFDGGDGGVFFLSRLTAAVEGRAGRRHRRLLRECAAQIRIGADSPKETELRLALVDAGLPDPDLQITVVDREFHSKYPASADLGYRRQLIAIHYDGKHHGRERQLNKDVLRNAAFERHGYRNIVVTARDADNAYARVIREVRRLWPSP